MSSLKIEIRLKKKNPFRAQIFRYFRIESRNNKTAKIKRNLDIKFFFANV